MVVGGAVAGQAARAGPSSTWAVCQVRRTTSPTRPMAWESDPIMEIAPEVVEHVLGGDGGRPDPALGEGQVFGQRRVQVVADHQHVEVLVDGVDGVRAGRVGRTGEDVGLARHRDDVGSVAAAGSFGVIGVDGPAGDGGQGVDST